MHCPGMERILNEPPHAGLHFMELRSLLRSLRKEVLAVAGHAVALSQWHAVSTYCITQGVLAILLA